MYFLNANVYVEFTLMVQKMKTCTSFWKHDGISSKWSIHILYKLVDLESRLYYLSPNTLCITLRRYRPNLFGIVYLLYIILDGIYCI